MNKLYGLILRYLLILVFGLGNLFIFYKVFYPLTFFPVSFILGLIGDTNAFFNLNLIMFNTVAVNIVNACVAGAAYYLLFILIMSTANISFLKRIKIVFLSMLIFLVFNIVRIVLMTLISGTLYFEPIHMFFWYFISIALVVLTWFLMVRIFNIKDIPVHSDVKFLLKQAKNTKRNK
jgi:exosortase/archaeosortase family protein